MLYGREAELRVVADLINGLAEGVGGALIVSGEAGIGKLLDARSPKLDLLVHQHANRGAVAGRLRPPRGADSGADPGP